MHPKLASVLSLQPILLTLLPVPAIIIGSGAGNTPSAAAEANEPHVARAAQQAIFDGYLSNADLRDRAESLARRSELCTLSTIGTSGQGDDLMLLTLGDLPTAQQSDDDDPIRQRPAILITAGLDSRHLVGSETAIRVAEQLADEHADLLTNLTFYIVPRLNPDGAAVTLGSVNIGHIGTLTPVDDDRDGRADEDGPNDLNNDGVITMMRRLDPPLDDPPTHLPDPEEPRLLIEADLSKGHTPQYSLYLEGTDDDGDGLIAEDGAGFVDLDQNFMHLYPEYGRHAGVHQLSEPEALAIAKFVVDHPEIVAAVTYGRHDNVINVPEARGTGPGGREPRTIDADDADVFKEIGQLYQESTTQTHAPKDVDIAGSLHAWLYAHRGLPSVASTVWSRPDLDSEDEDEQADDPESDNADDETPQEAANRDQVPGTWTGVLNVPEMGELDFTLTLERGDDALVTGTLVTSGSQPQMNFTLDLEGVGDADGNAIELTGEAIPDMPVQFKLQTDGNTMSGTVTGPDGDAVNMEATRQEAAKDAEGADAEQRPDAAKSRRSAKSGNNEMAKWLRYSDQMRDGAGFVEWEPYDHPTLGEVEIGGFVPGFTMNPPADALDTLAREQTAFIVKLTEHLPVLEFRGPEVEQLADGVWEVRFAAINTGPLPTATAMARTARAVQPMIVELSTPIDQIVSGERVQRVWGLAGHGGRHDAHWIIQVPADSEPPTITVRGPQIQTQDFTIEADQ